MQTFLPFSDYQACAQCLDRIRLGKQRVEAFQILQTLLGKPSRWACHPAVKMWKGHEGSLGKYGLAICQEWAHRGYQDTVAGKIQGIIQNCDPERYQDPPWLGLPELHSRYRAALLYKKPEHYNQFSWLETPAVPDAKGSLPYLWPEK